MNDLARKIADLPLDKRRALELMLMRRMQAPPEPSTIPLGKTSESRLLSYAQERLWFLDRLHPETPVYNIPYCVELKGRLDACALAKALTAIVERHHVLRTTFSAEDGSPVQAVSREYACPLTELDLRLHRGGCHEVLQQEARRCFDLSQDVLLRGLLVRLGDGEHRLLLNIHHIAADGWSLSILFRELSELYSAYVGGREPDLPALPIQYADYAERQREWLRGEALEKRLGYWRRQLAGAAELELPLDHPRPAVQTFCGGLERLQLCQRLMEALEAVSRREDVTLFMTLLAGFQALLHRYTGQEDVVVGTAVANRTAVETEGLIGFFVNTLALRTRISGDLAFRQLLQRVRDAALEAYGNQELPFEKLVEALQPERNLQRTPLFQVMFVLQNTPVAELQFSGLEVRTLEFDNGTAKFDLTISIEDRDGNMEVRAKYNTDLFEASTIRQMLQHYHRLLEGVAEDPHQSIATLPLFAESEPPRPQKHIAGSVQARDFQRNLQSGQRLSPAFQAPRDSLEALLVKMWEDLLGKQPIGVADNFFDLGGHSLLAARLCARLESKLARQVPLSYLFAAPTVESLARALRGPHDATKFLQIVPVQSKGSRPPFLSLDAAPVFRELAIMLGDDQPFYSLCSSFCVDGKPLRTIESIAARYVDAVREFTLPAPYCVGGWCLNGVLAYELARQLVESGIRVQCLVLFDSPDPNYYRNPKTVARLPVKLEYHFRRLRQLTVKAMTSYIALRVSGVVQVLCDKGLEFIYRCCSALNRPVPTFLQDSRLILQIAAREYQPKPYRGRIVLFVPQYRPTGRNIHCGWEDLALGGVEVHVIPGDHQSMFQEPNVTALGHELSTALKNTQSPYSASV